MNRKLFLLLSCLLVCAISFSQTNVFELRIEARNSSGESGVLATLTNLSDHVYTIPSFSNTTSLMLSKACISFTALLRHWDCVLPDFLIKWWVASTILPDWWHVCVSAFLVASICFEYRNESGCNGVLL